MRADWLFRNGTIYAAPDKTVRPWRFGEPE